MGCLPLTLLPVDRNLWASEVCLERTEEEGEMIGLFSVGEGAKGNFPLSRSGTVVSKGSVISGTSRQHKYIATINLWQVDMSELFNLS